MKNIRFLIMALLLLSLMNCQKSEDKFEVFISKFTASLVNNNSQSLKSMFGSSLIIRGFGESSHSLRLNKDYNGYLQKKGELYNALFVTEKMKKVFGYEFPCFAEAYRKQNKVMKGKTGNLRFIWIVLNGYRYEFTIEQKNNAFKVTGMALHEE